MSNRISDLPRSSDRPLFVEPGSHRGDVVHPGAKTARRDSLVATGQSNSRRLSLLGLVSDGIVAAGGAHGPRPKLYQSTGCLSKAATTCRTGAM